MVRLSIDKQYYCAYISYSAWLECVWHIVTSDCAVLFVKLFVGQVKLMTDAYNAMERASVDSGSITVNYFH